MKRLFFIYLSWIISLNAMDLSFLKVKEIVLDNENKYTEKNYTKANGKGTIFYKYLGLPPLEYNYKIGKFEYNKHDIKMGFILGFSARYNGEIKNGSRDGYGILESKMRLKYEGNWKNNKFHGKGILTQERSDFKYEGHFVNGIKEGTGNLSYYYTIYLNKDHTKYSLEYDKVNFPDKDSYKVHLKGYFKNGIPSSKAECYLVNTKYNSRQKCTFKDGKLQSKIKLPYKLLEELKKSEKRKFINLRLADETLEAISTINTNTVYIVAETNMKDDERVKITFFIFGKNDEVLVEVSRTTLVKNFQLIEKFDIQKILKENTINEDRVEAFDAKLEFDD